MSTLFVDGGGEGGIWDILAGVKNTCPRWTPGRGAFKRRRPNIDTRNWDHQLEMMFSGCSRRHDAHARSRSCQRGQRSHLRKATAHNQGRAEEGGHTHWYKYQRRFRNILETETASLLHYTLTKVPNFGAESELCNEAVIMRVTQLERATIAPNTGAKWCRDGRYL